MMKSTIIVFVCLFVSQSSAFVSQYAAITRQHTIGSSSSSDILSNNPSKDSLSPLWSHQALVIEQEKEGFQQQQQNTDVLADVVPKRTGVVGFLFNSITGLFTGLAGYVAKGMAVTDDYEMAELPPPYIPALFGVVLLAGVGILTSSLGDVMDEEASLGLQSGARAKKEIERSRSSYFGRRR